MYLWPALVLLLSACAVVPPPEGPPPVVLPQVTPLPEVARPIAVPEQTINGYRRAAGLPPVWYSPRAEAAARAHAIDMARGGFFAHRGSDGATHGDRLRRVGCLGGAENLARGHRDHEEVMAAWMDSAGHRRNILLPDVTHYGLARVADLWVLILTFDC